MAPTAVIFCCAIAIRPSVQKTERNVTLSGNRTPRSVLNAKNKSVAMRTHVRIKNRLKSPLAHSWESTNMGERPVRNTSTASGFPMAICSRIFSIVSDAPRDPRINGGRNTFNTVTVVSDEIRLFTQSGLDSAVCFLRLSTSGSVGISGNKRRVPSSPSTAVTSCAVASESTRSTCGTPAIALLWA